MNQKEKEVRLNNYTAVKKGGGPNISTAATPLEIIDALSLEGHNSWW